MKKPIPRSQLFLMMMCAGLLTLGTGITNLFREQGGLGPGGLGRGGAGFELHVLHPAVGIVAAILVAAHLLLNWRVV